MERKKEPGGYNRDIGEMGTWVGHGMQALVPAQGATSSLLHEIATPANSEHGNDMLTVKMTKSVWPRESRNRRAKSGFYQVLATRITANM